MNGSYLLQVVVLLLALPSAHDGRGVAQERPNTREHDELRSQLLAEDSPIRSTQARVDPTGASLAAPLRIENNFSSEELRKLMRPTFDFSSQWYAKADEIELATFGGKVTVPTFPIFGPPPPLLSVGFSYTDLRAPIAFDLPNELYETSFGVSWMRRINDRWLFRSMFGVANATDGDNNSSDAWQFRGGVFAIYRANQQWTWTVGAIALGRNDIPVVPALGLIYEPNPALRFDVVFPRPSVSCLLAENGNRQQWVYLGAALNGGTWAYERLNGIDDQITYRDWQFVLGWESTPRREQGMPFTRGRKFRAEIGYAFSREFEFERGFPDIRIGDALSLRAMLNF